MPLIKVQTNVPRPSPQACNQFINDLSSMLATALGKSEDYVMTLFESSCPMTFGASNDPTCYLEVKSIGDMTEKQTQHISEAVCAHVQHHLNIAPNRTYIEFSNAQRHLWGWNSQTFAVS